MAFYILWLLVRYFWNYGIFEWEICYIHSCVFPTLYWTVTNLWDIHSSCTQAEGEGGQSASLTFRGSSQSWAKAQCGLLSLASKTGTPCRGGLKRWFSSLEAVTLVENLSSVPHIQVVAYSCSAVPMYMLSSFSFVRHQEDNSLTQIK